MKKLLLLSAATLLLLTSAAVAQAQSIGVDFNNGDVDKPPVGPTESAGAPGVAQLNFNVNLGSTSLPQTLVDDSGLATTAQITTVGYGRYFSSGSFAGDPGNTHLFDSNLNNGTLGNGSIVVSTIPFASYDLYVYASSDNNDPNHYMTYKLTTASGVQYQSIQVMSVPTSFVQGTNSTYTGSGDPTGITVGDYVVFHGLTDTSFTLQFGGVDSTGTLGSFNAGLNGFQIVATSGAVPEPSTWAMLLCGLGALGFYGYRRNRLAA